MYRLLLALLFLLTIPSTLHAVPSKIPEELQPWIPWVLYKQEEKICTINGGKGPLRYCSWPSKLILKADHEGAAFAQDYLIETRTLVPLPGSPPFWPQNVTSNGTPLAMSKKGSQPAVWLNPGKHTIKGHFQWNSLPESLFIPPETGLLTLFLHGQQVPVIQLDTKGRLWFKQQKRQAKAEEESLSLQVYRKIEDGIPLIQHLKLILTVSGSPRQATLGLKIPPHFLPLYLDSPLPIRLDKENRLELQVRPGQWELSLRLRNSQPNSPEQLTIGKIDGPWAEQEIWVFAADQKLRQIEVKGVVAVDPSRTGLPDEWKKFPAYLLQHNATMQLVEKSRGNPSPTPNRIAIKRQLWLDELGSGLTVLDTISGTMTSKWRLSVQQNQELGRVEVDGVPRLITRLPDSQEVGVEVRKGNLSLRAESRIATPVKSGNLTIPAIGWNHDIQELSATLNLPPGWKVLTATGVDRISTWLNRWTLLDIFLVLITALATARILGIFWGVTALFTLTLCFHQSGSPTILWLPLLALLGLKNILHSDSGVRITKVAGFVVLAALVIRSVPYMIQEVRVGLFPQLEYGSYRKVNRTAPPPAPATVALEDRVMAEAEALKPQSLYKRKEAALYALSGGSTPDAVAQRKLQIDPKEMIQTGPGLPDWNWTKIPLHWNGPVKPEQKVSFLLLSPFWGTVLAFIRVTLLTLLIIGFVRKGLTSAISRSNTQQSSKRSTATLFALCFFSSLLIHAPTSAEIPSPDMLKELQSRLLEPPECGSNCTTINSVNIAMEDDHLQIDLQVDALTQIGVPLPGKNRFFDQIRLNNKDAVNLIVNREGYTTIRVQEGSQTITLEKDCSGLKKIPLYFPLLPAQAKTKVTGWSINGVRDNGQISRQISLTRLLDTALLENSPDRMSTSLDTPAFVTVERTLHVNLKWSVTTRIIRKSSNNVVALDIPLLPGEHVTSDGFHITDKHVRINMPPAQQQITFHSSMDPVDSLLFTAAKTSAWNEIWYLDISPIWHVETEGIPEINQTDPAGRRFPEFHPYPGESLELTVLKPEGVPGPTMTITRSTLLVKPGRRISLCTLSFSLVASRGMQHIITLPPGVELQKSLVNQKEIPLQLDKRKLTIPLTPGEQQVELVWRTAGSLSTKTITEPIDLGVESVNHSIEMQVPSSRWILLTGGPRVGPAVLFWGELLVIIVVALFLGRVPLTPLSTLQWLLLSLGLSQIPVAMAALVVAWLLLLGLRKQKGEELKQTVPFNLMQVSLVFLTVLALGTLFFAIQQGLLGHPDMQIGGNGSYGHSLHWYQDRVERLLPEAWVITVPLLVYRIAMLLWALWIASALLRWLRWGWECFTTGDIWKKIPQQQKQTRSGAQKKPSTPAKKVVHKAVKKTDQPKPSTEA